MTWDCFSPPQAWHDDRYVELRFERYMPSANVLVGKTLTEDDVKRYKLPKEYAGKIIESVSYPNG